MLIPQVSSNSGQCGLDVIPKLGHIQLLARVIFTSHSIRASRILCGFQIIEFGNLRSEGNTVGTKHLPRESSDCGGCVAHVGDSAKVRQLVDGHTSKFCTNNMMRVVGNLNSNSIEPSKTIGNERVIRPISTRKQSNTEQFRIFNQLLITSFSAAARCALYERGFHKHKKALKDEAENNKIRDHFMEVNRINNHLLLRFISIRFYSTPPILEYPL
jgi:hypothetical protein